VGAEGEEEGKETGWGKVVGEREKRGGMEKATGAETEKGMKSRKKSTRARHDKEVWVNRRRQGPHPNQ
jgi:hypothetical protein